MRLQILYLGLFLSLLMVGCSVDQKKTLDLPEEKEFYLFNHGSKVDALSLGCGYREYEKCSDEIKQEVRQEVGSMTVNDQIKLGKYMHEKEIDMPLTQHDRTKWLEEIVRKMKPAMQRQDLPYNVYTVNSNQFNAFTIPGGNIYVTTEVLERVDNIHELAYIVGHELGHNENDHTKESAILYKYNKLKEQEGVLGRLSMLWTNLRATSCGKADELECDISSMYLLNEAGYDPELALGGIEILREIAQSKSEGFWDDLLFYFFGSHPWSDDRVKCVKNYVREAKVKVACEAIYEDIIGTVVTRNDPLNIWEYPTKRSEKIYPIPRGAQIKVICECTEQPYRPQEQYLYVQYSTQEGLSYKGWVDQQYVEF